MKNRMVVSVSVTSPLDHMVDRELQLTSNDQHHESVLLNITSLGEDQNSKSELWF